MSYSFYFPTRFFVSDNVSVDLPQLAESPSGQNTVLLLADQGITQAGITQSVIEILNNSNKRVSSFDNIPGNPNVNDVEKAMQVAQDCQPHLVIAIGGGSVIDTAKAVSILSTHNEVKWEDLQWGRAKIVNSALPLIAIPTTAGTGSEVTHVAVIGDSTGFKKGVVHPSLFPTVALLDASLTKTLPPNLTATTGMDALVHGIEAYLGKRANPMTNLYALSAIRDIVRWLPEAVYHGENLEARKAMLQASSWAGIAFDQAGLGLCHALCGPLANHYHVHHGLGNTVLLPATLAFNAPAINAEKWIPLRDSLGLHTDAQPAILEEWATKFIRGLGLPTKLSELGVQSSSVEKMAQETLQMAMIGNNIRSASFEDCKYILEKSL